MAEEVRTTEAPATLEEALKELEAYREKWLRATADLKNLRRHLEYLEREGHRLALTPLIQQLLPILDDLERAFVTVPEPFRKLTWFEGLVLIYHRLLAVLRAHGVERIDETEVPVDPRRHEVVQQEDGDGEAVVLEVYQAGYALGGQVLRPALVRAGPKKETG